MPTIATWKDLVLPEATIRQLQDIASRVHRHSRGPHSSETQRGTCVVFCGPRGTGKTLAAQIMSTALGRDLWRINLAAVDCQYIGETQQCLDRIFAAANNIGAVLLFDDSGALFEKPAGAANTGCAHIVIEYLLQWIEAYPGLAILTCNRPQQIDQAFLEQQSALVSFPRPGSAQREILWRRNLPGMLSDADFRQLAALNLTGGDIREVAQLVRFKAETLGIPATLWLVLETSQIQMHKAG
jgi:SpoVK/Ycf46/Vps4 family AAA+-type ATPase